MFHGGLQKIKHVVSLVIDFEDGTREIIEFLPDNMAHYRVRGDYDIERRGSVDVPVRQFTQHDIFWKENHDLADPNS